MEQPRPGLFALSSRARFLIWLTYALCWTVALVAPIRDQTPWVVTSVDIDLKYVLAKTAHVIGYALFAGLTGWLGVGRRIRWLMMFVLMSHATVTELIQEFVPGRHGSLYDVAFDHAGVALGLLLTWKWWRHPAC
jgi:VanZ family protein